MPQQNQRTVREFENEEERQRWLTAVAEAEAEAEAEAPELIERHRQRQAEAAAEQSLSGQLRRAILASGLDFSTLAEQSELTAADIGAFMSGYRVLDSDSFGRLSAALNLQLTSIS